jgi:hypothetical protein
MRFMQDDEYLLLMNLGPHQLQGTPILSLDSRKQIREVGIRTAIEYPEWVDLEPAQGIYDFAYIESVLATNRSADMKTIFSMFNPWMPEWIPDDWRPRYQEGAYNTAFISIWNKKAIQYKLDFLSMLVDKYNSDDVMFIVGDVDTGESMLPSYAFYDDYALKDFGGIPDFENEDTKKWLETSILNYYVRLHKILYPQCKELWDAHQWLIGHKNPASCNFVQPKLLEAYRKEFEDLSLVLLQYTYFDEAHPSENVGYVDMLKDTYNCEVIAEAMFCKGFSKTTPQSIEKKFRGQIICPTHPHTHEMSFQPYMLEAIRNSYNTWSRK